MTIQAWQRASLPMLILTVLAVAPRHGYGLSQALVSVGLQPVKGAQLYPALARLEEEGTIIAEWEQGDSGPARKVYELTSTGRQQLEAFQAEWQMFMHAVQALSSEPVSIGKPSPFDSTP